MTRRYARSVPISFGSQYGTSYAIPAIRANVRAGNIRYQEYILAESERLDVLAGRFYGDGRFWWLICAASDCGWGLQVPPGTKIKIVNLEDAMNFVG